MIEIQHLSKSYGKNKVIDDLCLHIEDGERVALTAPSGCGKTTLLHIIAGLTKADCGVVGGIGEGDVSMLFQENRLFPRFTALENVMAVMKGKREEKKRLAMQWLIKVELTEEDAGKLPNELSGGQQQRVALARALAYESKILLLDEPFKGLDGETKEQIISLADRVLKGKTLILVTHDRREAEALGCRILSFEKGMKLQN